jgi:hypothetical protein
MIPRAAGQANAAKTAQYKKNGGFSMATPQKKDPNPNIGCNVDDCRYHCKGEQCCSLHQIEVLQENEKATSEHATCCHSFACK